MSSGRTENGKSLVTASNIEKEVKKYKKMKINKSWETFDDFCDYQTRLWQLSFVEDKETWLTSSCNCSQHQKNYVCKHIILQAIRLGYVEVPTTAKTLTLHDMPKRGRPSRVTKALQIDNNTPIIKISKRKASSSQKPSTSKRKK